jgi:segregation and condensation protein A
LSDEPFDSTEEAGSTLDVEKLVLDIDGYEGPLDVLLTLARNQKVDLAQISILQLAEQYLEFIAVLRKIRLELAADYLVMAAWLAYLKSRMLLPDEAEEDEPTGDELAAQLAFRLRRLEAMRERAVDLMSSYRLGRDVFPRGMPEGIRINRRAKYSATLYELLTAYAQQSARVAISSLHITRAPVYTIEDAMERLERMVGFVPEWTDLQRFLPDDITDPKLRRSALASTFVASLEIARQGRVELEQSEHFGPLRLRTKTPDETSEEQGEE